MNLTEMFSVAKATIQTPAFKRKAAQIAMVAVAAVAGAVLANKIDGGEIIETVVTETTSQVA